MKLKDIFEKPISGEWGKEVGEGEKGSKVIRTTNFTNIGRLDLSSIVERDIDSIKHENKKLKFGDIIIEKSGGSPTQPVGRVVIFEETNEDVYFCNNFTSILRPNKNIVPKFGLYLLKNLYNKKKVLKFQNKTTGIINIKLNDYLNNTEITIPNLEVQNRIAEVLNKTQELIDKRKEQIESLDELVKSKFIEMFGDPVKNPLEWQKGKIADIIVKTQYGTSNKADEFNGDFKVLRMNNITYDGNWDFTSIKYINLDEKEQKKYLVYKGEVLFNRTNSKELVGKTAVYKEDEPMAYAGYLVKAIPNERANGEFISAYMNTKYVKDKLLNMAKNIVGMANINAEEFKKIDVYIPPIELQNQFADFVKQVDKLKFEMEKSLKELEDNFNSLMQKAFRGELFK
ncbi:restriction endonuclease subunit S [Clostridium perfringens]|uniref:restriction endonuclease subunit S n=1 Tax=Clostridium perfringens TaxID=1502 RepID=UPI0014594B24|nr:restriction endonuclease subunit S [Clostridium perfringens]MBI6059880.1 restriction endonuclease subunit S [Clostridium perfringens]MDZ4947311.1 restriction endonuclease subunit S [Clostridium perfringens]NMF21013.1 restriction endonuclease subunit S [Clostridium perfringens]